jgi:hypothetical protein
MDADDEVFQRLAQIRGMVERVVQAVESGLPGAAGLADAAERLHVCYRESRQLQLSQRGAGPLARDLGQLAEMARQARSLCDTARCRGRALETALAELQQEALDLQRQLRS